MDGSETGWKIVFEDSNKPVLELVDRKMRKLRLYVIRSDPVPSTRYTSKRPSGITVPPNTDKHEMRKTTRQLAIDKQHKRPILSPGSIRCFAKTGGVVELHTFIREKFVRTLCRSYGDNIPAKYKYMIKPKRIKRRF